MSLQIERDETGGGRVGGLFEEPKEEPRDEELEAQVQVLAESLAGFFRAGGSFTWTEWMAQAPAVRRLAEEVGERVTEERVRALATLVGMSTRSTGLAAEVLGDPDVRREVAEAEVLRNAAATRARAGGF